MYSTSSHTYLETVCFHFLRVFGELLVMFHLLDIVVQFRLDVFTLTFNLGQSVGIIRQAVEGPSSVHNDNSSYPKDTMLMLWCKVGSYSRGGDRLWQL